jgi:hypothetical protein
MTVSICNFEQLGHEVFMNIKSACSLNVILRTKVLMLFPVAKAMPAPFSRRLCLTSWTLIHSSDPSVGPGSFRGAGGCWVTGAVSSTIVKRCATWKCTRFFYQYWGRFLAATPEKLFPMGLSISPDVFQEKMSNLMSGLDFARASIS